MIAEDHVPLDVPPLFCPLPSAVHRDVAKITARSLDWLGGLGLLAHEGVRDLVVRTRAAEWACRIAPRGHPVRLQIVSDWTHLGFVIDDLRFDAGALVDSPERLIPLMMRLMPYLDHPEGMRSGHPFEAGLRDLSARARECAPAAVVRRWVNGNMEWFFSVSCLTAYRKAGTMPTLDEYVNLGPRDRAMSLTGSLIEIAEGTCLPDEEREKPVVRAATQAANMLVTIGNDLFSFNRESENQVLESNMVGVVQHERGCTRREALHEVVALHDRIMCRYLMLREHVRLDAGDGVRRHVDQLDHLIRGNLEWSLCVPRYRGESRSPTEPSWATTPADDRATAPDVESIAWWWDDGKLAA